MADVTRTIKTLSLPVLRDLDNQLASFSNLHNRPSEMNTSKLSLRKFNNIERQIQSYTNELVEINYLEPNVALLKLNSGKHKTVRNFYEFYIDDASLLTLIREAYWGKSWVENFLDTHVGCMGSFDNYLDWVNTICLLKQNLNERQLEYFKRQFKGNAEKAEHYKTLLERTTLAELEEDFLFYVCQECGDSACGGIALDVISHQNTIIWTDNEELTFRFERSAYMATLMEYL